MRTVKLFLFAMVLLAVIPSCKKCYTCQITAVLPVCTCENGTGNYYGATFTGTVDQANASQPGCAASGGYWYQTQAGVSASNNKYCYATSGPLGGALNGAAAKESSQEDACGSQGGTWLPD